MGSFSFFHWMIAIAIFYVLYAAVRGSFGAGGEISDEGSMVCPVCGTRGEPKTITKGNLAIEIILWLCLIVPGLIYSIWRLSSKYPACPACEQAGMIGAYTPRGSMLIESLRDPSAAGRPGGI